MSYVVQCPECNGEGKVHWFLDNVHLNCMKCNSSGYIEVEYSERESFNKAIQYLITGLKNPSCKYCQYAVFGTDDIGLSYVDDCACPRIPEYWMEEITEAYDWLGKTNHLTFYAQNCGEFRIAEEHFVQ